MKLYLQNSLIALCASLSLLLFSTSCNNNNQGEEDTEEEIYGQAQKKEKENVFYTLTTPIELVAILNQMGLYYDESLLNPTENVSKYTTANQQAVNLGIYAADLTYCGLFSQFQSTLKAFEASKKLADGLGITDAYEAGQLSRIQDNINQKDSLLKVISECLSNTDAYLKDNYRIGISLLVLSGGWIEGLYIATQTNDVINLNPNFASLIGEQKLSLENILKLIEIYQSESGVDLTEMRKDLTELNKLYEKVRIILQSSPPKENREERKTTLTSSTQVTISPEDIKAITDKVKELRIKYTNA
jgi:hypothetical protein